MELGAKRRGCCGVVDVVELERIGPHVVQFKKLDGVKKPVLAAPKKQTPTPKKPPKNTFTKGEFGTEGRLSVKAGTRERHQHIKLRD